MSAVQQLLSSRVSSTFRKSSGTGPYVKALHKIPKRQFVQGRHKSGDLHRLLKGIARFAKEAFCLATFLSVCPQRKVHSFVMALNSRDWKVRARAARALGNIGDARALPALMRAMDDKMGIVRSEADIAIKKIKGPQK